MDGACLVAVPADDDPIRLTAEDNPHVTMLWFGQASDLQPDLLDDLRWEVDAAVAKFGPIVARVSGAAILGADRAIVLLIESEDLVFLRAELSEGMAARHAMMGAAQFPTWIPHLTLNYGGEVPTTWPEAISFDGVGMWVADQHTRYPLVRQSGIEYEGSEIAVQESPFLAAGMIPPIHCPADIPVALNWAATHPDSRWYVEKRCVALGAKHRIPAWGTP